MRVPKTCRAVFKRQVINLRSCCILLVDKVENREKYEQFHFHLTKDQVKKLHHKKSWLFDVLDIGDCDEECTIDYETLVAQHKDSLYYSETKEETAEQGKAKICHQKLEL